MSAPGEVSVKVLSDGGSTPPISTIVNRLSGYLSYRDSRSFNYFIEYTLTHDIIILIYLILQLIKYINYFNRSEDMQ